MGIYVDSCYFTSLSKCGNLYGEEIRNRINKAAASCMLRELLNLYSTLAGQISVCIVTRVVREEILDPLLKSRHIHLFLLLDICAPAHKGSGIFCTRFK